MRISLSLLLAGMITAAFYIAPTQSARAASFNVVGGQLIGATGVDVGGTLFDVEFVEGTCVDIFSGCNNAAEDFAFQNQADATLAAQALLDQVFIDSPPDLFDTKPDLTAGCDIPVVCVTRIPYALSSPFVQIILTFNDNVPTDALSPSDVPRNADSGPDPFVNWAKFTQSTSVPLPIPGVLLGGAVFAAFGFAQARRRRTRA